VFVFRIEAVTKERVLFVERVTYFPQLEQEQSEPQLQLELPEHPHSPFMMMVLVGSWEVVECVWYCICLGVSRCLCVVRGRKCSLVG